MVAIVGPGTAFALDGASFVVSALALAAIRTRPARQVTSHGIRQTFTEVGEGLAFVRRNPWCWATLLAAMLSLLCFVGPVQVLLPFLVKNRLSLGADSLGLIFAVGGVGSIGAAIAIGQRGLPRRRVTVMYGVWAAGVALLAGYGS
jgi:hypothetical protein